MSALAAFKSITTFVFDVDGVLTDGSLLIMNDGSWARTMNIKDGYALQLAVKKGYRVVVISGGSSEAVKERLHKLGITDVFMPATGKKDILIQYAMEKGLRWDEILFMGDDMPDYEVMQLVGLPCCPADAVQEIKSLSHYISHIDGGRGCARDVIEKVLKLNGHWHADTFIPAK